MILIDTSVLVDHLRAGDAVLKHLLQSAQVLIHPFVIGEIALGSLKQRNLVLGTLARLPAATVANDAEVLHFIDRHALHSLGLGYVDAHLLAATQLSAPARLWTRDKRLAAAAGTLNLAAHPTV